MVSKRYFEFEWGCEKWQWSEGGFLIFPDLQNWNLAFRCNLVSNPGHLFLVPFILTIGGLILIHWQQWISWWRKIRTDNKSQIRPNWQSVLNTQNINAIFLLPTLDILLKDWATAIHRVSRLLRITLTTWKASVMTFARRICNHRKWAVYKQKNLFSFTHTFTWENPLHVSCPQIL